LGGGRRPRVAAWCLHRAILINTIAATVSETEGFAEAWKAIIGFIFVMVVLYLPHGLAGLAHDLVDRIFRRRAAERSGLDVAPPRADGVQPAE
jgi:urea transport system permease protein